MDTTAPVPTDTGPVRPSRRLTAADVAHRAAPYVQALLIVVATTLVAEALYRLLGTTRLSMVFLGGVLIAALRLGAGPGLAAAGAAFVVYDFYQAEPRLTLQLSAPEDGLVLLTFLAVALLTGGLAGRVRDEAQRAKAHAAATQTLYQASRSLSAAWDESRLRERLVRDIASAAKGEAWLADAGQTWAAPRDAAPPLVLLEWQDQDGELSLPSASGQWRVRDLRVGEAALGLAAWRRTDPMRASAEEERLIDVLIDLGAAAIMRARLGMANSRMEAEFTKPRPL